MSSLNGRKVLKVQMHDVAHIDGLGQFTNTTLNKDSKGKLEMVVVEGGVLVKGTGIAPPFEGKLIEFIIPYAMCKGIQLVPEGK